MAEISEYEQLRLKRIEENRHMLFQLGLLPEDWKPPAFKPQNPFIRRPVSVKKKKRVESSDDLLPSRRSLRSVNSNDFEDGELTDSINGDYAESDCSNSSKEKYIKNRVNSYGAIEGVAVGEIWETRMECSRAGIHRPPVSGIHPGPEGAYSIALSGGYEDNYDGGESFTYTGAGGRDLRGTTDKPKNLRTGPQVKDQILEGANASLANSVKTRKPVRVIRGYKSNSPFAPEFGYRYDGLYQVEKYWTTKGLSGHLVYKFALKRCPDQDPPPWATDVEDSTDESTMKPSSKDGDNLNDSMNPFVHLGKKVDDLNDLDELETNEKLHTPYKKSEKEEAINNSVDVLGVKNNLNSSFDTIKNDNSSLSCTPELNGNDKRKSKKVSPEKSSASVHKNVSPKDVLRSPKKISPKNSPLKNKSDATATTPSKSPVKMIASNQSLDELSVISTDYNDVKNVSLELGKSPKVQRTLSNNSKPNLSKAPTSDSNPDSSLSNNKEVPENENIVQNNPLPVSFKDTTGYLKSRRRSQDGSSNVNNTGKKKGKKRSPSPDDFAKICDELCNELPKIEKVKRLRFSFDNFSDNDLEVNVVKARRKRASRTPRKSSLIKDMKQKSVKDFEEQNKSNEDLVFSKFIDIWLADFSFDESFNDWLGWDDYDLFEGWSDKEVTEAKKYSASFADFIFKCNENSEENSWAGWEDDVSRRSLVLNGFLLEEMSRNRRCSDSDGTEAPEEFLGFQQQNRVQKTD